MGGEPREKRQAWYLGLLLELYIGIMEKKMKTLGVVWGIIGVVYRDNGKGNGNYRGCMGFYWSCI